MKIPFYSIVIPTYNRAGDLANAIKSVLKQNYDNWEIVVSDNKSTDTTGKLIREIKDPRIRYYLNKIHCNVQDNIQKGISKARGKYIFLLGDDDILYQNNLLKWLNQILKASGYGYVRLNYASITPDKKTVFDFRVSKNVFSDISIKPKQTPEKIIRFIEDVDSTFISGLVIRNDFPANVSIIQSDIICWFKFLYFLTEKFGAHFESRHCILGSWSEWRPHKSQLHSLYSLKNGLLSGELYFIEVKKLLTPDRYQVFLKQHINNIYIKMFIAAKYYIGNSNLIQLARRILVIIPDVKYTFGFWVYLLIGLLMPKTILGILRKIVLYNYVRIGKLPYENWN
jgi:glycosyltransferase involved in cell wall biosynthesis